MSNLPGNRLPGNPHMNDLIIRRNSGNDYTPTVNATLALAYEQRTANLLKVLELQGRMQDVTQAFNLSAFDVAERLGLGDTK